MKAKKVKRSSSKRKGFHDYSDGSESEVELIVVSDEGEEIQDRKNPPTTILDISHDEEDMPIAADIDTIGNRNDRKDRPESNEKDDSKEKEKGKKKGPKANRTSAAQKKAKIVEKTHQIQLDQFQKPAKESENKPQRNNAEIDTPAASSSKSVDYDESPVPVASLENIQDYDILPESEGMDVETNEAQSDEAAKKKENSAAKDQDESDDSDNELEAPYPCRLLKRFKIVNKLSELVPVENIGTKSNLFAYGVLANQKVPNSAEPVVKIGHLNVSLSSSLSLACSILFYFLFFDLTGRERAREIQQQWCIQIIPDESIWILSDKVWYKLQKPHESYLSIFAPLQEKFDVVCKTYKALEANSDIDPTALLHKLGITLEKFKKYYPFVSTHLGNLGITIPEKISSRIVRNLGYLKDTGRKGLQQH